MNQVTVPQPEPPASLLNFIARAASDPTVDVVKLEALLVMQRLIVADMAKTAFNAGMAAAQAEMMPVVRDATNSHLGNRYARLAAIDEGIRPIYTGHGFSLRYGSGTPVAEGWIRVICTAAHCDGYSEDHYLDSPLDGVGAKGVRNKTPVQALGSTLTYLRRYLACMVFNVVLRDDPDDDDGEATRRTPPPTPPPPPRSVAPRQTIAQWLDDFAADLANCEWPEEYRSLIGRPDVQQACGRFVNGAHNRLTELMADAKARVERHAREARGE